MPRRFGVLLLALASASATSLDLRVVDRVSPACDPERETSLSLLAVVVDHDGQPMAGVEVSVEYEKRPREVRTSRTDAQGRAEFRLSREGSVRVRAATTGFARSTAERVRVQMGCLAGVLLPMQIEVPSDYISSRSGR